MNYERSAFSRFAKMLLWGILVNFCFMVSDAIWLKLLSVTGTSYGGAAVPLVMMTLLRAGLYLFWLMVLAGWTLIRRGALPRRILWLILSFHFLFSILGIYSFYVEPMQLSVGRIEVPVPGLTHPLRVVQLSDIHVERTTQRERAIPGVVNALQPDLIVITGDYLNESYTQDLESMRDLQALLKQLHPPRGIYAVNGNVETPAEMRYMLKGLDIQTLDNEAVRLPELDDHLVLLGLSFNNLYYDQIALQNLIAATQPGDFTILLYHKPDLAYTARDLHINLYLAGHTHGGQVRLPFYGAVYANSKYGKTFEMGLYHLQQTTLYVSRGLGMVGGDGPRVRFLCSPEIVVIDLIPA